MTPQQRDKISREIIETYEKNIINIKYKYVGHFFERAMILTQDERHMNTAAQYLYVTKVFHLPRHLEHLRKNTIPKTVSINKKKNYRNEVRRLLYKKEPRLPFYHDVIFDLHFLNNYGLSKTIVPKTFQAIAKELQKREKELRKFLLSKEIIQIDSSYAANSVFLMKHLGIMNLENDYLKSFKEIYLDKNLKLKNTLEDWQYQSLIYILTHIIIADSRFYYQFVNKHEWVIKFFSENLDEIFKRTNLDIQSEVALCYRLTRTEKKFAKGYKKALAHIEKNWSRALLKSEVLGKKEHTNSIVMLLFSKKDPIFKGPDVSHNKIFNDIHL